MGGSPLGSSPASPIPVPEVLHGVDVAPVCGALAAGRLAMTVPGDDCLPLGTGPYPRLATDVEDLGVTVEEDAGDRAVTSQHAKRVDVDDGTPVEGLVSPSGVALQCREVGEHHKVWFLSGD